MNLIDAVRAADSVHLSHRERSDRIERCAPGEGLRSLDDAAATRIAPGRCCASPGAIRPLPAGERCTPRRPLNLISSQSSAVESRFRLSEITREDAPWREG